MIKLIAVGKLKEQYLVNMVEDYKKRINKYHKLEIVEINDDGIEKEGSKILEKLSKKSFKVALTIKGQKQSSPEFAKFINEVKAYVNGKEAPKEETEASFKQYIAKPTVDGLVGRKEPGVEYDKVAMIDTDIAITIVDEEKAKDGGTWLKCKSDYYVNKKYMEFVKYV